MIHLYSPSRITPAHRKRGGKAGALARKNKRRKDKYLNNYGSPDDEPQKVYHCEKCGDELIDVAALKEHYNECVRAKDGYAGLATIPPAEIGK